MDSRKPSNSRLRVIAFNGIEGAASVASSDALPGYGRYEKSSHQPLGRQKTEPFWGPLPADMIGGLTKRSRSCDKPILVLFEGELPERGSEHERIPGLGDVRRKIEALGRGDKGFEPHDVLGDQIPSE
ncbi:MAG: hypothetical protein CL933_02120 [Deltaproteobacteria bacterium]|nr:hypothetical protein [Deltaproteobacteria bacterium]